MANQVLLRLTALFLASFLTACRTSTREMQSSVAESYQPQEFLDFFQSPTHTALLQDLPNSARLQGKGWPSYYWPGFQWGLLWRFFDQPESPLGKFERAFAPLLTQRNPGYRFGDLEIMERQRVYGHTTAWYGLCDGSSEASLNFPEPTTVKTVGDVSFYPFEMKALLSYFTAMASPSRRILMAGKRVHFDSPVIGADGRPTNETFRDINPGLFHLALGNYLGQSGQGLVADIIPGRVVLNFPIVGYRVLSRTANATPVSPGTHSPEAISFVDVKIEVTFGDSHRVLESFPGVNHDMTKIYEYQLELDATGRIIGGEWLSSSRTDHPDFIWTSQSEDLKLALLETSRLQQKILVGPALEALLSSADDSNSATLIRGLQKHPDALAGFKIFQSEDAADLLPPPEDPKMQAILNQ